MAMPIGFVNINFIADPAAVAATFKPPRAFVATRIPPFQTDMAKE